MSINSITSGGIDAKLTSPSIDTTVQRKTDASRAQAASKADRSDEPKVVPDRTAPLQPSRKDLQPVTNDDISSLVADLQQALTNATKAPLQVDFRPDERNKGFVIEIRTESGDLVRQFPPEIVLNLRSKLDELSGMVIDQMS